jgi:EAL domain-containing protein (putative c-di-GMP-specific phosphodiesterase class I)
LHKADAACYQAKTLGRNRFEVYADTESEASERKIDAILANDILEACENNDFVLYRQLIVECDEVQSDGLHYEILLRLKKTDQSILPPGAFIPAAERMKLMPIIDRWVVEHTLMWLADNPEHLKKLSLVAINLSGQTLADHAFGRYVEALLNDYSIPADKLCFEITETAAIARLSEATKFIDHMKCLGCKFSLDDFGSGLSSFTYLKTLDIDFLKIDGAFVKDIIKDENDHLFVDSINRIGHGLGKKTIAEFVETDEIRQELQKIGVDFVQGYGISRPIALSDV